MKNAPTMKPMMSAPERKKMMRKKRMDSGMMMDAKAMKKKMGGM